MKYKNINNKFNKIKNKLKVIFSSKYTPPIAIVVILLLALLVRLYRIENPVADWHSWRQADTASVTRTYVDEGINLLYPRYHDISTAQSGMFNPNGYRFVEFPLYNAVHAVFYRLIPTFSLEIWGRLVSILFSLVSVFLLYIIGRRTIGVWGGLLAAFYFAFIPYNIYFSRVILPEPLTTMLGLLSIFFVFKYTEKDKTVWLYLTAFTFSLALLVKPFTIFYGVPMAWLMLEKYSLKSLIKNKNNFVALLIAFSPFILWRLWENQYPEGIPFWKWAFNGNDIRFKPSFWRWIFSERFGNLILGTWGLIPLAFGIISGKGKSLFVQFFLLGIILYVSVIASANVLHDYYQVITIPAISLTLALGTVRMWESDNMNKILSRGLLIFSLFIMFGVSVYKIRGFYNVNHWEIVEAGNAVDRLLPKDALVIAPYNGDTAFLYQTKRWGWPVIDRPLNELIDWGAQYYVSVNYDDVTNKLIKEYELIESNEKYVILNLQKEK